MTTPSSSTTEAPVAKPRYWRSLSELNRDESFINDFLHREFPKAASEYPEGISRRRWMQLMGASLAMAGVAGCRYPEELIAPFVIRPAGRMPGETYQTATNFELAGDVYHLLISCVDGRPIKVEPNSQHPAGGVAGPYAQASVLGLYDPDRARGKEGAPLRSEGGRRLESSWDEFRTFGTALVRSAGKGERFAVVMSPTASPTIIRMVAELQKKLPQAAVCTYDSVGGGLMASATKRVFGKSARPVLDLSEAEVIVSLQSDFLGNSSDSLNAAKSFAKNRNPKPGEDSMSRLYVAEGGFTATGAAADVRLAIRPSQMPALLAELGRRVEKVKAGEKLEKVEYSVDRLPEADQAYDEIDAQARTERFLNAAAADLARVGKKGVVLIGDALGEEMIVAGIGMNKSLGSLGSLQRFVPTLGSDLANSTTLVALTDRMLAGEVDSVLFLDANVLFTAPGGVDVKAALERVEHSVYLGTYDDETAEKCQWSLPLSHPLESWGDCVDSQGFYGVCQPQILPLLGGRSVAEVIATMLAMEESDGESLVRRTADDVVGAGISERQWRRLLHDGYSDEVKVSADALTAGDATVELPSDVPVSVMDFDDETFQDRFEVLFTASEALYDGRFANNGWLQEMPQSITKLTWDNAAIMSPRTAAAIGVEHGLKVALRRGESTVELPVFVIPGCAPGVVSVPIGYGRTRVGMVGGMPSEDVPVVGVSVSPIRFADSMTYAYPVEARPRFTEYELNSTQDHWAMDELGRNETIERSFQLIREGTTTLFDKLPEFSEAKGPHVPSVGRNGSMWDEPIDQIEAEKPQFQQWGMSIDLTKCIGCNGCVIACQSENNVPIVGKEQVGNSREMHWLRIDRYFQGDEDNADVVQEPVACMHCETAPCEQVCPVAATVHTEEGLNAMTYNRCIGTRYCGNNCPYKVRRFNYFNYNKDVGVGYGIDAYPGSVENANRKLQAFVLNPEVTVRGRGVMEKCTYCVQRIESAKIDAIKERVANVADGNIVTACQAACPTSAIVFGDVSDPESAVSKAKADIRSYGMLTQLNVKPRTTYLARIRNTPIALMTRRQIQDLSLEAPHHGHGDHGHEEHGHEDHDHGDHEHDDHAKDEKHSSKTKPKFSLPVV